MRRNDYLEEKKKGQERRREERRKSRRGGRGEGGDWTRAKAGKRITEKRIAGTTE